MINFGVSEKKTVQLLKRMDKCGLLEGDIEEKFTRSSGPGGQKVNKTATCVQLKHNPSGLQVKMQKERSQRLNRFFARRRMCELLEERQSGVNSVLVRKAHKIHKQKDRRRRRNRNSRSTDERQ